MKVTLFLAIIVAAFLALATALPQIERGSVFAPSGMFSMTENLAAPPVDLSQVVFLPEATPVSEAPQEPRRVQPTPTRKN